MTLGILADRDNNDINAARLLYKLECTANIIYLQ